MKELVDLIKKYATGEFDIPEDKVGDLEKEFRKSFKSVNELTKVKADLGEALKTIEENKSKLEEFETFKATSQTTIDELTSKYNEATNNLQDIKIGSLLDNSLKGIEFSSKLVEKQIKQEIKSKNFTEKDGKLEGLNEYLEGLYKEDSGVFKTVDNSLYTWGGESTNKSNATEQKPTLIGKLF